MSTNLNCPACGGPIENISPIVRSISCAHCANLLYFDNSSWLDGGKFPTEIAAPALLGVERHGQIAGDLFTVAGRVRLEYGGGHWDEWWLEFENGEDRWLEEDDGNYFFHQSLPLNATPQDLQGLGAGQMFAAGDMNWFITESGEALVSGVQGRLPVTLQPGFKLHYFDAVADGREINIEVWGSEVEASLSQAVDASAISWQR